MNLLKHFPEICQCAGFFSAETSMRKCFTQRGTKLSQYYIMLLCCACIHPAPIRQYYITENNTLIIYDNMRNNYTNTVLMSEQICGIFVCKLEMMSFQMVRNPVKKENTEKYSCIGHTVRRLISESGIHIIISFRYFS